MKLKNLKTNIIGKKCFYYKEIDSTQSEIWRLIKNKKIVNGTIVIADIQTAGKGTHGRIWYTNQENNIAFSVFINTNCSPKKLEGITTKIAEIIVSIFKEIYNINLSIKLPNDLILKNKKIGGILTQAKTLGEKTKFLVIGIGINTNQMEFNKEIAGLATSIKKEFNIDVDNEKIISEFCNKFEEYLLQDNSFNQSFREKD